MKKSALILMSFLLSSLCYAQKDSLMGKEIIYRWRTTIAINSVEAQMDQQLLNTWLYPSTNYYGNYGNKTNRSISMSIIPKYYLDDNKWLRFELGITYINLLSHYDGTFDTLAPGGANTIVNSKLQQKIYRFSPGIQWNFKQIKFFQPYCGVSLYYLQYGKLNWEDNISDNSTPGRGTEYSTKTKGGFASGIGSFVGLNVFINKRISIGSEFSYSLLYSKIGGTEKGVQTDTFPNSPTYISNWSTENAGSKGIQFSKIMPSFNISFRF
jgi:hypothetical protein